MQKGLATPTLCCRIGILLVLSPCALCLGGTVPHGKGASVKMLLSVLSPFSQPSVISLALSEEMLIARLRCHSLLLVPAAPPGVFGQVLGGGGNHCAQGLRVACTPNPGRTAPVERDLCGRASCVPSLFSCSFPREAHVQERANPAGVQGGRGCCDRVRCGQLPPANHHLETQRP